MAFGKGWCDVFRIEDVRPAAERLVAEMRPACRQIAIAGSVRRGCAEVGDMEIVAEPILTQTTDMFEGPGPALPLELAEVIARLVRRGGLRIGDKFGPRYKKLWVPIDGQLPCIQLDLFIVLPPAQFGPQMVIRTGPASFSKRFVTLRRHGGLMPSHLREKDGCIWDGERALETPTEASVFQALGMKWIEPEARI